MFRGSFLLIFIFTTALQAQIDELATTGDGSTLAFRTGFRLQSEKDLGPQAKIYRWQNGEWTRMAAARDVSALNPPNVWEPFFSTDGRIFGWHIFGGCNLCMIPALNSSEISGTTLPAGFPLTNLRMSANGRYFTGDPMPFPGPTRYLDVQTGAAVDLVPSKTSNFLHLGIANDGTVLLRMFPAVVGAPAQSLALWKPGSTRTIYSEMPAVGATLSAEGGRIAFETVAPDGARQLSVIDGQSGERIPIAPMPSKVYDLFAGSYARPAWDASGTLLVYRSFDDAGKSSIALWDAITRESRTLLRHEEGFSSAVISGDGRIVWAVTGANRLLRMDRQDGTKAEMLPALGENTRLPDTPGVPGSAVLIRGVGFQHGQTAAVADVPVPVVDVEPDGIWVQIPWEFDNGTDFRPSILLRSSGNPFETVVPLNVSSRIHPLIATTNERLRDIAVAKAIHQDFSALVTADRPARPGETIHVYLTGLGPLDRAVSTGEPGPGDPPARPLVKPQCRLSSTPLEMPFLAYAPGLVGVYQADFTMPDVLFNASPSLFCTVTNADGSVSQSGAVLATTSER